MRRIYTAEDTYISEDTYEIVKNGKTVNLSRVQYNLLKVFLPGKPITRNILYPIICDDDHADYYKLEEYDAVIDSAMRRLRKKVGDCFVPIRGIGYRFKPWKIEILDEEKEVKITRLPQILTKTAHVNTSTEDVIFRGQIVNKIIAMLNAEYNVSIQLSGFGGVGKTAIARLVYSLTKNKYDSCGWIDYHKDLKISMIESVELQEYDDSTMTEKDYEKKWKHISHRLRNSPEKKLIVIDNVDYDNEEGQNPNNDEILTEITGRRNTDVIITSRLGKLRGYQLVNVENLGDSQEYDKCISLFYHYNPDAAKQRERNYSIVSKLVELAGYNTMIIELLAKISIYESSLEAFYHELSKRGFRYSELPVSTMHGEKSEPVHLQLVKLFTMKSRTDEEKKILWRFQLLPEGEKITRYELENWLGICLADIDGLSKEGWIPYKDHSFSIHPLIRQAMKYDVKWMDAVNVEVDITKASNCIEAYLYNQSFFDQGDSFELSVRKVKLADSLLTYNRSLDAQSCLYLADFSRKKGMRAIALKYYEAASSVIEDKMLPTLLTGWGIDVVSNLDFSQFNEMDTETIWRSIYFWDIWYPIRRVDF